MAGFIAGFFTGGIAGFLFAALIIAASDHGEADTYPGDDTRW